MKVLETVPCSLFAYKMGIVAPPITAELLQWVQLNDTSTDRHLHTMEQQHSQKSAAASQLLSPAESWNLNRDVHCLPLSSNQTVHHLANESYCLSFDYPLGQGIFDIVSDN
jgi:hypothetical protein